MERGVVAWLRRTPGRLCQLLAGVALLAVVAGVTGATTAADRAALVDQVITRDAPIAFAAQELYRSLSDADATAAAAFLTAGPEPVGLRDRYRRHLAAAGAALATVAGAGLTGGAVATAVTELSTGIPVYAGLVETARAYHRQGLPLGAAYLRQSSGMMRETLLPAAQRLFHAVTEDLAVARQQAARFPGYALPLGGCTVAALIATQLYLARRTRRLLNPGLLVATGAAIASVVWLTVAWAAAARHLEAGHTHGSAQMESLVEARTTVLRARGDEALILVARGNGAHFEASYDEAMARLLGTGDAPGLLDRALARATHSKPRQALVAAMEEGRTWRQTHEEMRDLVENGDWDQAAQLLVGEQPASTAAVVGRLDAALATAISHGAERHAYEAERAASALSPVDVGVAGLTVVVLFAAAAGFWPRIREYT